jgi:hypothetical protein
MFALYVIGWSFVALVLIVAMTGIVLALGR